MIAKIKTQKIHVQYIISFQVWCRFGLWCLTPLSTIFQWQSVLLVEETGVPRENHWSVTSHWQTLSHIKLCRVHLIWAGFELTTLVVIGTDCVASYKSNYHMITATMTPIILASEKCQKSQVCKDPFSWSSRCSRVFHWK